VKRRRPSLVTRARFPRHGLLFVSFPGSNAPPFSFFLVVAPLTVFFFWRACSPLHDLEFLKRSWLLPSLDYFLPRRESALILSRLVPFKLHPKLPLLEDLTRAPPSVGGLRRRGLWSENTRPRRGHPFRFRATTFPWLCPDAIPTHLLNVRGFPVHGSSTLDLARVSPSRKRRSRPEGAGFFRRKKPGIAVASFFR